MGGENHEKREAENLQQENGEREGGCSDGWRSVGLGGRRSVDRKGKWVRKPVLRRQKREMKPVLWWVAVARVLVAGAPSAERGRPYGGEAKTVVGENFGGKDEMGNGGKWKPEAQTFSISIFFF
jgi:hypothetical protein